jgi:MoaA/NifB/PqqE/SkfB family radical SAM enzyme
MLSSLRGLFIKTSPRPYRLFQVESALDCSLECVMCPWIELRQPGAVMSWETFSKIAADFRLTESVDLTGGGEPLKNPRLPDMVQAAKAAGCDVGFSTNATRLTPELSERLVSLELDWISFSVDAATAGLYERIRRGARFQQVTANIAALRDAKARRKAEKPRLLMVFVMMTGAQENYPELPAFIELAHSLGVEQVVAKNLDVILKPGDDERRLFTHSGEPLSGWRQSLELAQTRADELGVSLRLYALQPQEVPICEHDPLRSLFFTWEGDVAPCVTLAYAEERFFAGQRVHTPCQRFGSLQSTALEAIWNCAGYREFRRRFEARLNAERQATLDLLLGGSAAVPLPPAPEGCRTCYYLYGV